jgi:ubiquinone biosynthesis protein COQ4
MTPTVDRIFGEKFLTSIDDFYGYGVHLLFNDWWEKAPAQTIAKYVEAIASHPDHGPLAQEGWYAEPLNLATLEGYGAGTLGHAYLGFMRDHGLVERLALGYRELHEEFEASGKLDAMPPVMKYKVLRGYQTHDLHHVLTGYPATPFGELALQAFQLAQMDFPYAAMTIAVIMGHMTLIDPYLIQPAMDAITDGWAYGRRARSLQFVKFELMFDRVLSDVQREYGLDTGPRAMFATPDVKVPDLLRAVA